MDNQAASYSRSRFEFHLPEELIAQYPAQERDQSKLMVVDRRKQSITSTTFSYLNELLQAGDSLVFNDTKVLPARLLGQRPTGGKVELLLLKRLEEGKWSALAKPFRKLKEGMQLVFSDDFSCTVTLCGQDGECQVEFHYVGDFYEVLQHVGQLPLPHYIERSQPSEEDQQRYQTVYAKKPGACAAPTAGLHFTEQMLQDLAERGVRQSSVTLHVGLGTFRPVQTEDIRDHKMHEEWYQITPKTADILNHRNPSTKQILVGTTTLRTLESAASEQGVIAAGEATTGIFIYPGYQFRYAQHLLTNFHLPGSTLMMLVCAFGGYELMMQAYEQAVKESYRFFSYGDAMLIL